MILLGEMLSICLMSRELLYTLMLNGNCYPYSNIYLKKEIRWYIQLIRPICLICKQMESIVFVL